MGQMIPLTGMNWVRDTAILRTEPVYDKDGLLRELLVYTSGAGTIKLSPEAGQKFLDALWSTHQKEEVVFDRASYERLDGSDREDVL